MRRRRWLPVVVLALGALVVAGWAWLRQPAVGAFDAGEIRAVEVRFERWGEDRAVAPGADSTDPETIEALVAVLRTGVETPDHKCASRGVVSLRRSLGRPVELRFLPGHHVEWYEFRYGSKVYRVPRGEFVEAMRRVGVEVPLKPD